MLKVTLQQTGHTAKSQQCKMLQLVKSATGGDVVRKSLDAFVVVDTEPDDYDLCVISGEHDGMKSYYFQVD